MKCIKCGAPLPRDRTFWCKRCFAKLVPEEK